MNAPTVQLILDFPLDPVFNFDNLVVDNGNRHALEGVKTLIQSKTTGLVLTGESGTGKTHLLQAAVSHWRKELGGESAIYLNTQALGEQLQESGEQDLTRFLVRHESSVLVAVDDLEELESNPTLQEGVLYLYNRMRAMGGHMLAAGRQSPRSMEGLRADLRSRLLWGQVIEVEPPEDEALGAILAKMIADRQVRCAPELIKFLHMRLPRRVPDYTIALDRLNDASLGMHRRLTVPLAKEVLGL